MEPRDGLGLAAESINRPTGTERRGREHFQRDSPTERFLHGLINDSHSAMTDLPDDAEVTELLQPGNVRSFLQRDDLRLFATLELLHHRDGGEQLLQFVGVFGVPSHVLGDRRVLPAPTPLDELVRDHIDDSGRVVLVRIQWGVGRHDCSPLKSPVPEQS